MCAQTFTEWIVSVVEYISLKLINYKFLGFLFVSGKCGGAQEGRETAVIDHKEIEHW